MSNSAGPKIIRDSSLVLNFDTVNQKSYAGTGTSWVDLTRNKINGTLTGTTVSAGSLSFDGTTSYVTFPTNSNLTIGTNNFSLEMWIKPVARSQTYPILLFNGVGGAWAANYWQINDRHANNPTKFTFWCYNYSASVAMLVSSTAVTNGTWYHLVVSRIGTTFSMYLNAKLETSVTSSISIDGGLLKTYGFSGLGGGQFNGLLSLIKVYNGKGLSSTEILQNYNAIKARFGY